MTENRNPKKITKVEASKVFSTGTSNEICDALVSVTFYEEDWKWSQTQCLHFLNHKNCDISGLAATCLGHIARIHHKLDKKIVIAALKTRLNDPNISGRVQDALDDIDIFLK